MMEKQTAGRDQLGAFAPKFARLNDDVLFGQVWGDEDTLSPKLRSIVTVTALMVAGNFEQLDYHLMTAKKNGVSQAEIAEIITHAAFYIGWPKAWSAFNRAKTIWAQE